MKRIVIYFTTGPDKKEFRFVIPERAKDSIYTESVSLDALGAKIWIKADMDLTQKQGLLRCALFEAIKHIEGSQSIVEIQLGQVSFQ